MKYILLILLIAATSSACDNRVPPPSAEEREAILEDAPELFRAEDERVGLTGLDGIYLGQSNEEALEALAEFCPKTMEYRGGKLSQNAWFRGCVLREPKGPIVSVRVGFWPDLDDRVATLEVKRTDIGLDAARERFRQMADEVKLDVPRPGMVEMRATKYQMLADVDEGKAGPLHLAFGYTQSWAKELQDK